MHFQYYNSHALLVVNPKGAIRVLYTPFRVQCINPIDQIPASMWLYVDEVLNTKEDELIFVIHNQPYYYRHFKVEVGF